MNLPIKNCIWCNRVLPLEVQFEQLFSFKPLTFANICKECWQQILPYKEAGDTCRACGRAVNKSDVSYEAMQGIEDNFQFGFVRVSQTGFEEIFCYDCVRWLEVYPRTLLEHKAVLQYNDFFREWLYRYKYQGDFRLRLVMRDFLQEFYRNYVDYQWLILPSSPNSMRERGFNATAALLEAADIPCMCPFEYIGDGQKQAQKDRLSRLQMRQPFALSDKNFEKISQKIIVFDDVYTTGRTLLHAKSLLREKDQQEAYKADNISIIGVSLARDQQLKD